MACGRGDRSTPLSLISPILTGKKRVYRVYVRENPDLSYIPLGMTDQMKTADTDTAMDMD
jgi:hypothetical protein